MQLVLKMAEKLAIGETSVQKKEGGEHCESNVNVDHGYSISYLKDVWDKYHGDLLALQKRQKNLALIKSMYMPCTILSSIVGIAATHVGLNENIAEMISYVMYALAAVVLFYGLFKSFTDRSIEEKEQITEEFQQNYVCPNPECRHFMGNMPYNILRQNKKCAYCKCKLSEQ